MKEIDYNKKLIKWVKAHYWDSLEKDKNLILRHLRTFVGDGAVYNTDATEQTFFIPGPLPGLNEIIAAGKKIIPWLSKGKRRVYELTQLKERWDTRVVHEVMFHKIKPMAAVDVKLVWIEPNRRRDKDNVMAGKKFILDGLVKAGVLPNDGWKQIGSFTENVILGDRAGVIVVLRERENIA